MRAWLWGSVVVALLVQPAQARMRAPSATTGTDAPLPRSAPIFFSFGMGANYLYARWREYDPLLGTTTSANGGPAIQLRFGVPIGERVTIFIQSDLAVLFIPGHSPWLGTDAIGLGATLFLPESPWYLELGMRRGTAGTITDVGIQRRIPIVANIDGVWLAEIGVGHATLSGRVDSGPALSLFGGVINPDGSSGWGIGTSLLYRWSCY
jgi:hypothetical protein